MTSNQSHVPDCQTLKQFMIDQPDVNAYSNTFSIHIYESPQIRSLHYSAPHTVLSDTQVLTISLFRQHTVSQHFLNVSPEPCPYYLFYTERCSTERPLCLFLSLSVCPASVYPQWKQYNTTKTIKQKPPHHPHVMPCPVSPQLDLRDSPLCPAVVQ